jgi:hypothetical protein
MPHAVCVARCRRAKLVRLSDVSRLWSLGKVWAARRAACATLLKAQACNTLCYLPIAGLSKVSGGLVAQGPRSFVTSQMS